MKNIILLIALLTLGVSNAQWAQGPKSAYLKLGTWYQPNADRHFADNGKLDRNAPQGYNIPAVFARVGVSKKLTVTAYVPMIITSQDNLQTVDGFISDQKTNLGDIDIYLEHALWNNDGFVGGVDLMLGLPTGKPEDGISGALGSGDGEFNQQIRLLLGASYKIGKQNFYWKGTAGFNNRTNGFSDEHRYSFETGTTAGKWFMLGRFNTWQSLYNGDGPGVNSSSIFSNNLEKTTLGAEVTHYFTPKIGLSVGYTHILSGRVIYDAPGYTVGIVHTF